MRRLAQDAHGRPIFWLAEAHGVTGFHTSCPFRTRAEAIRWAKFEAHYDIDFKTWSAPQGQYPNETARDDVRLDPTFIATWGASPHSTGGRVTVTKMYVCDRFNWAADKDWETR